METESESPPRREQSNRGRFGRRVAQYGVLLLVLLAPLLVGGAHPQVQVALSAGTLLVSAAWLLSRRGDQPLVPFTTMALVAVAATLVQLIPLPHVLVASLSERALDIRSDALGNRPTFLPLTLDVPATVLAALRAFACLAILVVTAKMCRWPGRTTLFAVPLALAGGLIGALSFAQRWLGAQSILGIYRINEMPGSGFFGTFVNGNHAASFFSLSALMALGCLRQSEGPIRTVMGISAAISGLAVFSTGSRMGLVALAIGLLALATCWLVAGLGKKRGLLVAGALVAMAIPLVAFTAASQRAVGGQTSLASVATDQKLRGWTAAAAVAKHFPWTGVGRGAFEGPAAMYRADHEGVRLVFPENLPLQMLSEWGLPITVALCVLFLIPAAQISARVARWEPVFQGAACGVLAVIVHELADFGLEVLGVAFPAALALGLCAGRLQMSRSAAQSGQARPGLSFPVLVGGLGAWAVLLALGVWAASRSPETEARRAHALSSTPGNQARDQLRQMVLRHPAEYYFELLSARQAVVSGNAEALRHVNRALRLYPESALAHVLAAHQLARAGLRKQAAMEYRLAVERGHHFDYVELVRLVGPDNVFRAVPQRPEHLLNLANASMQAGRHREADVASARATELAGGAESARIRRMQIALESGQPEFVRKAALELSRSAVTSQSFELSAEGLARTGDLATARTTLKQGLASQPGDGGAVVRAARVLAKHGDLEVARGLLSERTSRTFSLNDRIAAEQLLAEIAQQQGHGEAAAAARARVRLLERVQGSLANP